MTYVLGINASGFISSACLIKDGQIISANSEERFTKIKKDQNFPHNAIKFCLKQAGIDFADLDVVSSGWNPAFYMDRTSRGIWQTFRDKGLFLHYIVNELGSSDYSESMKSIDQEIVFKNGQKINVEYIDHHIAHASHSFYMSGLDSSLVLVLDGFGEIDTGGLFKFQGSDHKTITKAKFPHSFGMVYSTFTQFLGFRPNFDEWKIMALASSGNSKKYKKEIEQIFKIGKKASNNLLELDLSYFDYFNFYTPNFFSDKLIEVFGEVRSHDEELNQRHLDIAAALQEISEEKVLELINEIAEQFPNEENLCLSGGFFMNSALNGKISSQTKFKNPFIGPCPDDTGISIGSAFASSSKILEVPKKKYLDNFFGSEYTNNEIEKELKISKINYSVLDNLLEDAAKNLLDGKIIGWFQGRSELGQRALGHRSILASPIFTDMKDTINKYVKFREEFRPFAPSILEEFREEYFEIPSSEEVYFMEKVFPFKENKKKEVPSVVHTDGTGRIHFVSEESNEIFYKLIKEFQKKSNVPIVLNTSFNTNNVPIVESPKDALTTFYSCGIDMLYMNNI
ncbi:hypothetical protein OAJ71_04905, partial [Nitrosopumilus sp.]|nr:hypothetical protein [Nitrosopumilus sp.]